MNRLIVHNILKPVTPISSMLGFFGSRRRKAFECDVCYQKFDDLESMEEHRRRMHRDAAPNVGNSQRSGC
jgi:hypothetical protein